MTALPILSAARRYWWAPIILGLTVALLLTRGTLAHVRAEYRVETAQREKATAIALAANAERARVAADDYASRIAAIQPVIVRSIDKVQTYATTPAGRAPCLAIDRVRDIEADRGALFADPAGGAGAVSSNPATNGRPVQR